MLPRGIPWGLERNFGIKLQAICATASETFASVFVPEDDVDAQYHLMGRWIKPLMPRRTVLYRCRKESDQVEGCFGGGTASEAGSCKCESENP
jgi:hypothetical protein